MHRETQSAKFMQAMIGALIVGGIIFWIGAETGKPAGREDLKVEVTDIRSNVSEAMKIIEAAMTGSLTAKYFRNETAMLQEKLVKTSKTLGSAKPEHGLEEKFAQARQLADSAAAELGRLSPSFGDKLAMEDMKAKLAEIFEKAVMMEKELEQ
jgi:hypothetical protein